MNLVTEDLIKCERNRPAGPAMTSGYFFVTRYIHYPVNLGRKKKQSFHQISEKFQSLLNTDRLCH